MGKCGEEVKPLLVVNGVPASCSNCSHWKASHLAPPKKECTKLWQSRLFEDAGIGVDFQPHTSAEFFCAEWEPKE